jgi:hypothetical protein
MSTLNQTRNDMQNHQDGPGGLFIIREFNYSLLPQGRYDLQGS